MKKILSLTLLASFLIFSFQNSYGFQDQDDMEVVEATEMQEAEVAVAPGIGFGEYGEGFVRIGLVENEHRIRQAAKNVKKLISG